MAINQGRSGLMLKNVLFFVFHSACCFESRRAQKVDFCNKSRLFRINWDESQTTEEAGKGKGERGNFHFLSLLSPPLLRFALNPIFSRPKGSAITQAVRPLPEWLCRLLEFKEHSLKERWIDIFVYSVRFFFFSFCNSARVGDGEGVLRERIDRKEA